MYSHFWSYFSHWSINFSSYLLLTPTWHLASPFSGERAQSALEPIRAGQSFVSLLINVNKWGASKYTFQKVKSLTQIHICGELCQSFRPLIKERTSKMTMLAQWKMKDEVRVLRHKAGQCSSRHWNPNFSGCLFCSTETACHLSAFSC